MPEATRDPRISPAPLRWALAPLRWLERARGRKRLVLAICYLFILAIVAFFGWWAAGLRGLPDVGDPFDVAAFRAADVPPERDAYARYRRASRAFRQVPFTSDANRLRTTDWPQAPADLRQWVEANREALGHWRIGAECDRALGLRLVGPSDEATEDARVLDHLRGLQQLALLDASRLTQAGDPAGAWPILRAALRASRHVEMRGGVNCRLIGAALLGKAVGGIDAWSQDPRVGPELLRRAIDDVRDCEAMTPPASETLKAEYLAISDQLDRPSRWLLGQQVDGLIWYHNLIDGPRLDRFLLREPERSRRLARLFFANWLAACDRPPGSTPMVTLPSGTEVYRLDDPGGLTPAEFDRWLASTMLLKHILGVPGPTLRVIAIERHQFGNLRFALAERWYEREHGAPPAKPSDLLGRYLDEPTEGFEDIPDQPDAEKEAP